MYYAHTVSGRPEHEWELLASHLAEVASGARDHARSFGAEGIAGLAGWLHDLGKYGPEFQARLHDASIKADHSTAGAVWALQRLPPRWGRLLAHVVAGHHTGLTNDLLSSGGRLESKAGLLAVVERATLADGVTLPPATGPTGFRPISGEVGFQLSFLTRMIFSCLIDADRTAAARFDALSHGEPANLVEHPSLATLEAVLHAWMGQRKEATSELDTLRDEVLRAAITKASESKGVFTLTVPTGGGKTLTSLAFALAHARWHGLDRVIVVIPFTSVIEQTAAVYREALAPLGDAVLEHHSAFERTDEAHFSRGRVGPDRLLLSMERWDNPIVVTTAVQFFESLFSDRPSRCRKLHALARSVIVLDEAQTMPLTLLRPCVAALKELVLNYGASVVLCTATQPALDAPMPGRPGFRGGFESPQEIAPNVTELFTKLRRVTVRDIGSQDDAALVTLLAGRMQALCIVNQRAHARALFLALHDLAGARHLSTCMHSVHRARVLAEIRVDLKSGRPCRVVSTSLIEAGVDVDFPLVLRASAGLDQIAQAAGRCNREGRRLAAESEVLVFKASEYGVIRQLVANAETGKEMLRVHADDPFAPSAMRAYFEMLYWRQTPAELDRGSVLEMCAERKGDLNFPFESIASAMRFIDDTMVPVIVPKEEEVPGKVAGLVQELRYAKRVGGIARKLGRYTVGVPRGVRSAMIAGRVAEAIRFEEFGDQFVLLGNLDLYTAATGLDWGDLTFIRAEALIVS